MNSVFLCDTLMKKVREKMKKVREKLKKVIIWEEGKNKDIGKGARKVLEKNLLNHWFSCKYDIGRSIIYFCF